MASTSVTLGFKSNDDCAVDDLTRQLQQLDDSDERQSDPDAELTADVRHQLRQIVAGCFASQ